MMIDDKASFQCLRLFAGLMSLAFLAPFGRTQTRPGKKTQDITLAQKMLETAGEVQKQVAALRGKPFKHNVKKSVRTEKQLRAYLEKEIFEEELGKGKLERNQWMFRTVGLLPKDKELGKTILDVLLNQIGGFYDPKQNSFFMMEKTARMGDFLNRIMVAHELTHALDDQYHGLNPIMKKASKTEDGGFAIGAVVEGSATALMTRWMLKNLSSAGREGIQAQMKAEQERSKAFFEAPPYFWTLAAKYVMGMRFLVGGGNTIQMSKKLLAMPHGVGKRVDQALETPPQSSEQILHPEKFWDPKKLDLPIRIANKKDVEEALLGLLGGGKSLGEETLGEILCAILARPQTVKFNPMLMNSVRFWTNKAAEGWGGDLLFMFQKKDGKRGIVWITLWDRPKDAREFGEAYEKHHAKTREFGMAAKGKAVILTYGAAQGLEKKILEMLQEKARFVKGENEVEIF